MHRHTYRLVLGLVALVLVLVAPARAALGGTTPAEPAAAQAVGCATSAVAGANSVYSIQSSTGVRQPFDLPVSAAACSLALDYAWSAADAKLVVWDPLTLAPNPNIVALRTGSYNTSVMTVNHLRVDYSPPLVTGSVPHVAEPLPTSVAFDFWLSSAFATQNVHYWPDGPVGMPRAIAYDGQGASLPMVGTHPVLGLGVCPPEGAEAELRNLQSVVTTSAWPSLNYHDYLQKFRVPQRCELWSVEIPTGVNYMANVGQGHIAVFEASGQPDPPAAIPTPALAEANFFYYHFQPGWESHYAFAAHPVLEPGRDYWLWVYTGFTYNIGLKSKTGGESVDFHDDIGPTYTRQGPYVNWDPWAGFAMNFRLVGRPLAPSVSVPPSAPARGLHLRIEPNPATSLALVRWAGAAGGGASFDVLDARGRRVARHDGAGEAGTWAWRGATDGGVPLPAGIYFVRAVDRDGVVSTARIALVR